MKEALVSIIMPNYNAAAFITASIESVLAQSYPYWELIIVDDASTDDSIASIEKLITKDLRITLIKLSKNSGTAVARNKALDIAKGTFIAFLDSDDCWHPEKLAIQVGFMQQQHCALSFTSYVVVNELGDPIKVLKAKEQVSYKDLLKNNFLGCLTVMYSVSHLGKVYFPLLKKRQDWALWLKITKKDCIARGIEQPLAYYTKRKSSLSSNKLKLLAYNWKVYRELEKLNLIQSVFYFTRLFVNKMLK
ncbi:glycosyltransferase family 2 protein [uncultured Lutibacter sp.]|uniref:glycosyltransferase family 2 protein n=1 Tax=uncultured Lutibacter sp. TaxID=437739 RepID=UPI00261C1FB5|nr:glycosyltransferase family 2 protein [uncultured Lutibacter sp.]